MKISAIPSISTPITSADGAPRPSNVENIRTFKMATNATPLSMPPPELSIPPHIESQAEASVEATQPLSPQLALLAKQRRALQVKERELADREKALTSRSQGSDLIDVARLKSEPLSVLLENGVTYDQLTEAIIAGQGNSEINSLKAEIEALRQGVDQKFTERNTAERQQVVAQIKRDAEALVRSGDEFELVRDRRMVPKAVELIERTYDETGEIIDVHDALQDVENFLLEDARKLARLKKIQREFAPAPLPAQQRPTGMRTLSNKDTASVPISAKARAMAAFYGTRK